MKSTDYARFSPGSLLIVNHHVNFCCWFCESKKIFVWKLNICCNYEMHYLTGEILTLACVHEKTFRCHFNDFSVVHHQCTSLPQDKCCAKNKASQSVIFTNNSHVYSRMYFVNNDKADCIFGIQQCRSSKAVLEKLHIFNKCSHPSMCRCHVDHLVF